MVFDANANDLFQIIGELYVEKTLATRRIMEQDVELVELRAQLSLNAEDSNEENTS